MNDSLRQMQLSLCQKYGSEYCPPVENMKIAMSISAIEGKLPINGLRHPPKSDTTGWYIWGGTEWSDADEFFRPFHLFHLVDRKSNFLKYLGLAPGWRFLTDFKYDDVWYDLNLLKED